ncbi:MAG TPA: cation:proton antiporter [Candidatus Nanoarchaeia archaeon]|nr:cation:proton antiporter [Candidatus Nanoarchaeia archaeon]
MVSPFIMILVALLLAFAISEALKRILGIPRVVGQVGAGLILGLTGFHFLFSQENLDVLSFLANLGIILLFYYVGLETNFSIFKKNIAQSLSISLVNTTLPFVLGFLVMKYVFEFNTIISLIIGVALSVSAQSISIGMLEELKLVKSKIGSIIISAGAVDDLIELILVSILLSFFQLAVTDLPHMNLILGLFFFVVLVIVARLWFIPYTLKFFDREKSSTARFTGALLIVLLIASLSELLGMGFIIGAMIAGMVVRQTIFKDVHIPDWEEHDIARSIHIIAFGFLIPLFFVWVGLNIDVSTIGENVFFVIILILIALVGTVGGTAVAVMLNGKTFREGLIIGWGLTPKGDVELGIATIALKAGIITPAIFTSLVIMALFTTFIAPLVFKYLVTSSKQKLA